MKMTSMKMAILFLFFGVFFSGMIYEGSWSQFKLPMIQGSQIEADESILYEKAVIENAARKWFVSYYNQLIGWNVPYDYRVEGAELTSVEMLGEEYVQLDYKIRLSSENPKAIQNHKLTSGEDGIYIGTRVLQMSNQDYKIWTIENDLTLEEYYELLPSVSMQEISCYVWYNDGNVILAYSVDGGESQYQVIYQGALEAPIFCSKTNTGCYVTFAIDRLAGSEYYATYWTNNMKTWERMDLPEMVWKNQTSVLWTEDGYGYYSCSEPYCYYLTKDNGKSFEQYYYPEPEGIVEQLGYNPFDTIEEFYEKDGILYMRVGQGSDGDYCKNWNLVTAIYASKDGEKFEFLYEKEN